MKHAEEPAYLGGLLTRKVKMTSKTLNRIAYGTSPWRNLDIVWKETQCSVENTILIHNAVIHFKLPHTLETVAIPANLMSKLEAFQLKGLRKILGMAATFVNRPNTNLEVSEERT